mmetsp:Transcript_13739/g.51293  ORF Transcript_13739/g.51293 Transcript_13739/m.51293 type:complete len:244 (+) Transcript_13739:1010-1741(+)
MQVLQRIRDGVRRIGNQARLEGHLVLCLLFSFSFVFRLCRARRGPLVASLAVRYADLATEEAVLFVVVLGEANPETRSFVSNSWRGGGRSGSAGATGGRLPLILVGPVSNLASNPAGTLVVEVDIQPAAGPAQLFSRHHWAEALGGIVQVQRCVRGECRPELGLDAPKVAQAWGGEVDENGGRGRRGRRSGRRHALAKTVSREDGHVGAGQRLHRTYSPTGFRVRRVIRVRATGGWGRGIRDL